MKKLLKSFCLCLAIAVCFASCTKEEEGNGTGSIYGIVTDADNGEPIKSASVSLNPGGKSTVTGTDGRYEFLDMQPGQYTVQIVKSGYETNTKGITVEAETTASGDMVLTKASSKLKLNTNAINFESDKNTLSFNISNIGTTGSINWRISTQGVNWIQVSPESGTTATGKTSEVIVTLLRDKINGPTNGIITVIADGESLPITVSAEMSSSGGNTPGDNTGENPGDDTGNNPGENTGTFSGTVTSCRPQLAVELTGISSNNGVVTIDFTIQNNETFDISQFAASTKWGPFTAYDIAGNMYDGNNVQEIKIGNKTGAGNYFDVRVPIPQSIKLNCSLKIKGVSDVTELPNVTLPCLYYGQGNVTYDQEKIVFKNLKW